MSTCDNLNAVRDYALEELPAAERPAIERHLATCPACAAELDQLRLTTAALRMLPDQNIPQRIAFVSDKVFQPSPAARFFSSFWKPGLISASIIAAALIIANRPSPRQPDQPARTIQAQDVTKQINEAVEAAVARVRSEDTQMTQAALHQAEIRAEAKQQQEHRAVMEAISVLQERQNAATLLAAADTG